MTTASHGRRERVLQFGTGRFLRGFVDAFLDEENGEAARSGDAVRRAVTMVESSGSGAAGRLRAQGFRYHLLVRGLDRGRVVDERRVIDVIDGAIDAHHLPEALAEAALDPELSMVISNTTEAGYAPGRLPAHLSWILEERARAGLPGVTLLPCELVEGNGRRLRELVLSDARGRGVDPELVERMDGSNAWAVTLVDRIATAPPTADPITGSDPFAVVVEP